MQDKHLTTSLPEKPFTAYEVGYLEPDDVQEFASHFLDLDRRQQDDEAISREQLRLTSILEVDQTKIAIARPVGGAAIAGYAYVLENGGWSLGPLAGPNRMPRALSFYLKSYIDPEAYPPDKLSSEFVLRKIG